jgi:hypothetical protein
MISTKQRTTIAICALAIVAVLALFASAPLVATHQASAFWGRGWGWGGRLGRLGRLLWLWRLGLVNSLPFFIFYIL